MNRKKTRELAMKLLFEMTVKKEDYKNIIENLKESNTEEISNEFTGLKSKEEKDPENIDLKDIDMKYLIKVLKGVEENKQVVDEKIEKHLKKWKLNRVAKVDLAILRLCTYELLFEDDIPEKVSINEGIEIAKVYGEDKSPSFVNAVLDSVAKN